LRDHVGTYRRELPVSLERLYENALDWEHLPYLHRSSFRSIEAIDVGPDRWRADVGLVPHGDVVLELALDRACRRWITTTIDGPGAGTEIWTHAHPEGDRRTDVVVDFFVPGVPEEKRQVVGDGYARLYAQLYDEDVWMMAERQAQLDERRRPVRTVEVDGAPVSFVAVCPHLLGPLGDAPVVDGIVECPWHGYRFDVRTGESVSGQRCRLAPVRPDDVVGWSP